jgi:trehalose-phosphatase
MTVDLASMSLAQKVGQLFFIGIAGPDLDAATRELLDEVSPGGICLFARNIKELSQTRELLDNLYHLVRNTHLNVLDGHKVIEVRAAGIDKGIATGKIMELFPSDFIFAMGDDKTDEDIFNVLKGRGVTVKVGSELSSAEYNVRNQREAFRLLDELKADNT